MVSVKEYARVTACVTIFKGRGGERGPFCFVPALINDYSSIKLITLDPRIPRFLLMLKG